MVVSIEVQKIIKCTIYSTIFLFTSDEGVDDVNEFAQYVPNYFQYAYTPI